MNPHVLTPIPDMYKLSLNLFTYVQILQMTSRFDRPKMG